jgi:hypothetical protein
MIGILQFAASWICCFACCQDPPTANESSIVRAGLGRRRSALAMLGFTVEGSDISTGSIQRVRREASLRGLKAEFRNDDMRILSTAPRNAYDAVIAMDNALPHPQCDEDLCARKLARLRPADCPAPVGSNLVGRWTGRSPAGFIQTLRHPKKNSPEQTQKAAYQLRTTPAPYPEMHPPPVWQRT